MNKLARLQWNAPKAKCMSSDLGYIDSLKVDTTVGDGIEASHGIIGDETKLSSSTSTTTQEKSN